jgi:UDPglucose--hexose-1-phosphate uridylyltransferase
MYKISTRLADGRELIYYDRRPGREPVPDRRELPPRVDESQVRLDQATGDWIIVADHRQDRTFRPVTHECPLCPTRGPNQTEIPAPDYDVAVLENRFPALTDAAGGRCEVICFSSEHDASFVDLKPDQVRLVLDVWTDRTAELAARPGVIQVFCFENRGPEMGVTLHHPHGQIYAYPYVAPRTAQMLVQANAYRADHGANLFDALVEAERSAGTRMVAENEAWLAFVPYAARWPYEAHLYPKRRHRDLTELDEPERDAFGDIYLDLLRRFDRLFDTPAPYVAAWHQAPGGQPGTDEFALHLELFTNRRGPDRLKVLGGTEVALGAFSNDIGPESAAARLRDLGR